MPATSRDVRCRGSCNRRTTNLFLKERNRTHPKKGFDESVLFCDVKKDVDDVEQDERCKRYGKNN